MKIYKNYDTSDILLDKPCIIEGVKLYPVKLKDFKEFEKYSKYICYSHEHLGITDYEISLLPCVIMSAMIGYKDGKQPNVLENEQDRQLYLYVVNEIAKMFSIVCREKMEYYPQLAEDGVNTEICFSNLGKTMIIRPVDFDDIRTILLKQNVMFEPKIYESEMQRKWAEKVKKARSKKSNSEIGEVINLVSCEKGVPYHDLDEYNVLQLYADYFRLINTKEAEAVTLFRTVATDGSKLPNIHFSDAIINKLYKNPDDDLFIDSGDHALVQAMQ
jgi:hypothetical protein